MGNLLERHADKPFYATEKLDGFSFSFGMIDGEFVASTRDRMIEPLEDSVFGYAIDSLALKSKSLFLQNTIFQAELIGPTIRGNPLGVTCPAVYIFDVIRDGLRVSYEGSRDIIAAHEFTPVPLIAVGIMMDRDSADALCRSRSRLNPAVQREGIVCRTMVETYDDFQGRVSFKVFNPAYPFHH